MSDKQENVLKAKLAKLAPIILPPKHIIFGHQDMRTSGVPDWSLTLLNYTSWWEFKHATPKFDTSGIQELTCLRLAAASYCRYVIWMEEGSMRKTLIVHPKNILTLLPEAECSDFNFVWLLEFMSMVHKCRTEMR